MLKGKKKTSTSILSKNVYLFVNFKTRLYIFFLLAYTFVYLSI